MSAKMHRFIILGLSLVGIPAAHARLEQVTFCSTTMIVERPLGVDSYTDCVAGGTAYYPASASQFMGCLRGETQITCTGPAMEVDRIVLRQRKETNLPTFSRVASPSPIGEVPMWDVESMAMYMRMRGDESGAAALLQAWKDAQIQNCEASGSSASQCEQQLLQMRSQSYQQMQ